jgi:hypothetical protein
MFIYSSSRALTMLQSIQQTCACNFMKKRLKYHSRVRFPLTTTITWRLLQSRDRHRYKDILDLNRDRGEMKWIHEGHSSILYRQTVSVGSWNAIFNWVNKFTEETYRHSPQLVTELARVKLLEEITAFQSEKQTTLKFLKFQAHWSSDKRNLNKDKENIIALIIFRYWVTNNYEEVSLFLLHLISWGTYTSC